MMKGLSGKHSFIIVTLFILLLSLTACSPGGTDEITGEQGPEELQKEKDRFSGMISSLDAGEITRIELIRFNPLTDREEVCASDDGQIIQTWITLLKKAEISPALFDLMPGDRFAILFYDADRIVDIGSFMFPYIYNATDQTMNVIENYEDLKEEFENAKELILPGTVDENTEPSG